MLVDDPGIGVVGSIEILMRFKCLGNWREYRIKMSIVRKEGCPNDGQVHIHKLFSFDDCDLFLIQPLLLSREGVNL